MLTEEQEFGLATRFREENDLDAARQLVLSHLRLVISDFSWLSWAMGCRMPI
jgi:RNA polymerase sigma-32 factor